VDDDGGGSGSTSIRADLKGLQDFGGRVRGDLDGALKPGTDRITGRWEYGVGFGWRSASHEVQAAAQRYHVCLEASTQTLAEYVRQAEIISNAAVEIARAYSRADAFSAANSQYVEDMLRSTAKRVDDAQEAATAAAQEAARKAAEEEERFLRSHRRGAR
jgi:hypothetical protein